MTPPRLLRVVLVILVISAILLVSGKLYTDWQVRRGEALSPPDGQFIDIDGVRLHYVARGDGPPLVFIHGMAGVYQDFAFGLVDSLERDFTCILFDRIGSGYSGFLPFDSISLGVHARYIHEAVRKLGISKPLIVGHSYGGGIALAYALWYPDDCSGLVLLAPAAYPLHKRIEMVARPLAWGNIGPFLVNTLYLPARKIFYPYVVENAAAPDTVPTAYLHLKQLINIHPANVLTQLHEVEKLDENLGRLAPEYGRLKLPVTIVTGDKDRILPHETQALVLAKAIPQSNLIVIRNAGHLLPQCRPDELVPPIRAMAKTLFPEVTKQD